MQLSMKWLKSVMIVSGLLLSLIWPAHVFADTLRVGEGLDPSVPGNYTTIYEAMNASQEGDVIRVESGVYDESVYVTDNRILIGSGNTTRIMGDSYVYTGASIVGCYVDGIVGLSGNMAKAINCEINRYINCGSSNSDCHVENCIIREGFSSSYYFLRPTIVGNKIYRNVSYINEGVFFGNIVTIDENYTFYIANASTVVNNSIEYLGSSEFDWFQLDTQTSATVEHNTIVTSVDLPVPNTLWQNNIIYSSNAPTIDTQGNLLGDPLFVDIDSGDFHLAAGSPAVDAGRGVDSDGTPADIGMYGGVRNTVWTPVAEEPGRPVVGQLIVTPNPIAPGEPLRLRFTARSTP